MESKSEPKIRCMTLEDFQMVLTWANEERWFFSLNDAEPFLKLDANGFFLCEVDGKPVGAIITPKYGIPGEYGFIDIFLVKEGYRGKGYGTLLLNHAMNYLKDCKSIGLEATPDMKEFWEKKAFVFNHCTLFFRKTAKGDLDKDLVNLKEIDCLDKVVEYDTNVFGYSRREFLSCLLKRGDTFALGAMKDNVLVGFGILRTHHRGQTFFFGPVSADTLEIAKQLIDGLQSFVKGKKVTTSIYDCNKDAAKIISHFEGWKLVGHENRMYKGSVPKMDVNRIYCPVEEFS